MNYQRRAEGAMPTGKTLSHQLSVFRPRVRGPLQWDESILPPTQLQDKLKRPEEEILGQNREALGEKLNFTSLETISISKREIWNITKDKNAESHCMELPKLL